MTEVSTARLYMLRASYALIAFGLAAMIGPGLVSHPAAFGHARGVMFAMLGGLMLLAAIGLRHPLRMLPLLMFELVWKTIWLLAFWLPASRAGALDAAMRASLVDCVFGVVLALVVIPWRYVFDTYVRAAGEPWRRSATSGDMPPGVQGGMI